MRRLVKLIVVLGLVGGPAAAADDLPGGFTFKRVGVPSANSATPRITVQIDPSEQVQPEPAPQETARAGDEPTIETAAWFWSEISPDLDAANPGRIEPAVAVLDNVPDDVRLPSPRLQLLQQVALAHGTEILGATVGTDVSPALVLAVIAVESAGKHDAVSSAGAVGLMQLMPATAERFGVSDRKVPAQSIRGGVAYLDLLMKTFNGDPVLALAAYNAGENAVLSRGGVPPFAETRDYVPKVLAAWRVARGLCLTPPELASDGCVFAGLTGAQAS